MHTTDDHAWLEQFTLARDFREIGATSRLERAVHAGDLIRVAPGIHLPAPTWEGMDADTRVRVIVHAAAIRFPGEVFSHRSAAALWRLPSLDRAPAKAEAVTSVATGGRSRRGLVRYAIGVPAATDSIDGTTVTDLATTVAHAATRGTFSEAVAFADRALSAVLGVDRGPAAARAERSELRAAVADLGRARGSAQAARAVEFADGLSGSPGESLSRVAIHMLGFPPPELQVEFFDERGFVGRVDFWWPEYNLIGEFDGWGKYLRHELRPGLTMADAIAEEKIREDRLRALGPRVIRWQWRDARMLRPLEAKLRAAGLPQRRAMS